MHYLVVRSNGWGSVVYEDVDSLLSFVTRIALVKQMTKSKHEHLNNISGAKFVIEKGDAVHWFRVPYILSHLTIIIIAPLPLPSIYLPLIQQRETPQKVTWALISARIIIQIFLMIILRIPPLTRRQDLGNNISLPPLLIRLPRYIPRNTLLLRIVIENPWSVLWAGVWALAIRGRWVVHLVEELE